MKDSSCHGRLRFWLWLAPVWALAVQAQELTQTFRLEPGWNSLYVEVDPADRRPEVVFTNLVVESVWTYAQRHSTVDFISDPSQPMTDRSQWLRWYPPGRIEARFNNLFAVVPNRAYLVKLPDPPDGASSLLFVAGRPAGVSKTWAANAYTLRGVPADDVFRPTFADFFQGSPAHCKNGQLQPIYRLGQDGQWSLVAPGDVVERGQAYWIRTQGASQFTGALALGGTGAAGLDFGGGTSSVSLEVRVLGTQTRLVRFLSDSLPAAPLHLRQAGATEAASQYAPFPSVYEATVGQTQPLYLQFEADRAAMETPVYGGVYALRDGAGTLLYLPVRIER